MSAADRCRVCGQERHPDLLLCADADEAALCLNLKSNRAENIPPYIRRRGLRERSD